MHYYFTAVSLIAGICLGFGILYLFVGLRRKSNRFLNLTFAMFALCYAATLLNGIRWYSATTIADYIAVMRQDALFVVGAYVGLLWYVAYYTKVRPVAFLSFLSAVLLLLGSLFIVSPASFLGQVFALATIDLPWGEQLADLDAAGSVWYDIVLLARLCILGYIVFALSRQFARGGSQPALILTLGLLPLLAGVFYEVLGDGGLVPYIPFGEFGFLSVAIAASLQMANSVIKTEEQLDVYRLNLEEMVAARTSELEAVQGELLTRAEERAAEAERSRLAHDLHDVVTQILFSINLIALSLPRLWQRDPAMAESATNELRRLARGALAEMRILLRELRPHTIVSTEMRTLLTQLCDGVAARHDIPTSVIASADCALPEEVHLVVYRIAQEAINNVTKHAEANQLDVYLTCDEETTCLSIADNGLGFEPDHVPGGHMGLGIMRERADKIGANLSIDSKPGEGTTVTVTWTVPGVQGETDGGT